VVVIFLVLFSFTPSFKEQGSDTANLTTHSIAAQNKTQLRYPVNNTFYDEKLKKYETKNQHVKSIFSKCGTDSHCATDSMSTLSRNETKQTVLDTLNEITASYDTMDMLCHNQAHHLGEFLYGYSGNLTEALLSADRKCGGGLYHGIMKNYFQTELFFEKANADTIPVRESCDILGNNPYSHIRLECTHGTGHALSRAYNLDVFSALKRCDEFNSSIDQRACYRGVFMENLVEHWNNGGGTYKQDDIFYPCSNVQEKYAGDCYHYQSQYILGKKKYVVEDSFNECDNIKSETLVKYCYYGLGVQISFAFAFDETGLVSTCQKGDLDYATFCLQGAVYRIVDQNGVDEGISLCKELTVKFKEDCYDTIGKWVHTTESDVQNKEKICSTAETLEYYLVCINANPEELESL
jgi:hypothetical protein